MVSWYPGSKLVNGRWSFGAGNCRSLGLTLPQQKKQPGETESWPLLSRLTVKSCLSVFHYSNLLREQNCSHKGATSRLSLPLERSPTRGEVMSTGSPLYHQHLPQYRAHSNNFTFSMYKVTMLDLGTTLSSLCV